MRLETGNKFLSSSGSRPVVFSFDVMFATFITECTVPTAREVHQRSDGASQIVQAPLDLPRW